LPTLRCFFAIYTDGPAPQLPGEFQSPPGTEVTLEEMPALLTPGADDELFGPHAVLFARYRARRGWLLSLSRAVKGGVGPFFADARRVLLEATTGVEGWAVDVLRLWPFPLIAAAETLPEEVLAEDLFSVGFTEMGEHGYRAETVGLSKLDQREISFEFRGKELIEEAALLCGHLADWVMDHGRRVDHGQSMSFGFDRLTFVATEGESSAPFRGWHPAFVQRALPAERFPGVGVLEVLSVREPAGTPHDDLSLALERARDQRLLLEELDLTGDAPHHTSLARLKGHVVELKNLSAWRDEPTSPKDSGWHLVSPVVSETPAREQLPLGDITRVVPDLIRYLALPAGVRLEWDARGQLRVDTSRIEIDDDSLDDEPD
jgi:hypothetical protein